mgnify:CR=1 FL=1
MSEPRFPLYINNILVAHFGTWEDAQHANERLAATLRDVVALRGGVLWDGPSIGFPNRSSHLLSVGGPMEMNRFVMPGSILKHDVTEGPCECGAHHTPDDGVEQLW